MMDLPQSALGFIEENSKWELGSDRHAMSYVKCDEIHMTLG